jgi:hypothetical protein
MNHLKNDMNQLVTQLLRHYSADIQAEVEADEVKANSPYFTTRLWAHIRQEQQAQQFWEIGVISARKWLFGLSVVALLFFFGNLVAIGTQTGLSPYAQTPSMWLDAEEGDYVEEALIEGLHKE